MGDGDQLIGWLVAEVLTHEHREDHVREAVFDRCRSLGIQPPSTGRIDWLVRSAFHRFEARWCASVFERLSAETQHALDDLLANGSAHDETEAETIESRRSVLSELKRDAGAVSLESVLTEIAKLERLRGLGLRADLFSDVSLKIVQRRFSEDRRAPGWPPGRTRSTLAHDQPDRHPKRDRSTGWDHTSVRQLDVA